MQASDNTNTHGMGGVNAFLCKPVNCGACKIKVLVYLSSKQQPHHVVKERRLSFTTG